MYYLFPLQMAQEGGGGLVGLGLGGGVGGDVGRVVSSL